MLLGNLLRKTVHQMHSSDDAGEARQSALRRRSGRRIGGCCGPRKGVRASSQCGVLRALNRLIQVFDTLLQQRSGEFIKMKSFTTKALAVAAAAACGSTAFAGSQTATQRNYALEAITNSTAVTLADIKTQIGVARTAAQDFTVVVKPQSSGSKFDGTCPIPTIEVGSGGTNYAANIAVSLKRASATECAYEVDVTNQTMQANNILLNLSGLVLQNHSLAAEGATESINVGIWDLGETARIDNSDGLVNVVAKSQRAVTLSAAQDTGTTADVNFNGGNSPLFGFVNQNADTTTVAEANFSLLSNNSLVNATGSAFDVKVHVTKVTFTVTGDQDGLDVANAVVNVNLGGTVVNPTVAAAGNGTSATLTFNTAGTSFANGAPGATGTVVQVKVPTANTKSLGTSRTFGVSAVVDPALPNVPDQNLAGNASWWVWGANAIELRTAFFNNDTSGGNLTRFFFQNTGSAAKATAVCHGEQTTWASGATTPTYGSKQTFTLDTGTTAVNASDICTFDNGSKRGSIVFTINSAASKVKGVYQQAVNGTAAGYIPLERPYGASTY